MSKERLTVMVAPSMAGEKLSLVIGKAAKPRCFKRLKKTPLPYDSNKKAWMTSAIFEKFVRELGAKMRRKKRRIALVLDNCSAHPKVPRLENVQLVYLPPGSGSFSAV